VSETGRHTRGTGVEASEDLVQLKPGGYGLVSGAYLAAEVVVVGELPGGCHRPGSGGRGEGLRRSRDEAAGVKPGASPVNRMTVNAGTARVALPVDRSGHERRWG
jgi:hypothetical protein